MGQKANSAVFDMLTEKQREALFLAASGLTSKEIARDLGISPHSVDKRIDMVRAQLGSIPRHQLVREFRHWHARCESTTGEPSPLDAEIVFDPKMASQPAGDMLLFEDALTFGEQKGWERHASWLHPGIRPSDLSVGWRLMLVLAASFLAAAAFVLVAAAGNVLVDLLR
ncbi:helix-turn-helix domain-containing protein [Qipengyuania gelatinilytica]|nr:helix-turn-helix transcriptional regulator [Qipengyuania gelatinilytica]